MEIKELVKHHNYWLDQQVNRDAFLGQRVKARLAEPKQSFMFPWVRLGEMAIIHLFLFVFFVFGHALYIRKMTTKTQTTLDKNPFNELYRSNSEKDLQQAFAEVLKWQK